MFEATSCLTRSFFSLCSFDHGSQPSHTPTHRHTDTQTHRHAHATDAHTHACHPIARQGGGWSRNHKSGQKGSLALLGRALQLPATGPKSSSQAGTFHEKHVRSSLASRPHTFPAAPDFKGSLTLKAGFARFLFSGCKPETKSQTHGSARHSLGKFPAQVNAPRTAVVKKNRYSTPGLLQHFWMKLLKHLGVQPSVYTAAQVPC